MIKSKKYSKWVREPPEIKWEFTKDFEKIKHGEPVAGPHDTWKVLKGDKLEGPFDLDKLDNVEFDYDTTYKASDKFSFDPDSPDPESILQFKKDPLSVIMFFTAYSCWKDRCRNYDYVFNKKWIGEQNYTDAGAYNKEMVEFKKPTKKHVAGKIYSESWRHDRSEQAVSISLFTAEKFTGLNESWELVQIDAKEIKEYYREKLAYQRLQGEAFSSFEEDLSEFIKLSDIKQCKLKHIAQVVKLDQFHKSATALEKLTEGYNSFEGTIEQINVAPGGSFALEADVKFEGIHKTYISRERTEISYLIFRTKQNNLLKVEHNKDEFYEDVLKFFKEQYIHIRAQTVIRTNPLTGFAHLDSRFIEVPDITTGLEPFFS